VAEAVMMRTARSSLPSAARLTPILTLLLAVGLSPLAAVASPAIPGPVVIGQFATPCLFSHRAMDDPIVFPREPGMSHSHDFIGNVSTDAFSTAATMRAAGTRCLRLPDTSGYWVPTLYQNGVPVEPEESAIYYQAAAKDPRSIVPFPAGLKVIVGDAHATEEPDPAYVNWHCEILGFPTGGTVPRCLPRTNLVITFTFPDCWDGKHVDSVDHKRHMAYAEPAENGRSVCPGTHPVPVPRISLNIRYATPGGAGVRLASGSPRTAHADFFNAWDQTELAALVRHCLNENRICDQNETAGDGII
jgi:hypothetical protein